MLLSLSLMHKFLGWCFSLHKRCWNLLVKVVLFFKVCFFFLLSLVIGEVCCLCKFNVAINAMEEESPKQFHTIYNQLSSFCVITYFARMTIGTFLVFTFCKFQLSSFCFVLLCKFKYSCRSEVSCFRVYGFSLIDSMHHGIFTTPKWFMNNLFFFVKVLSVVNVGTSNQVVNVVWNTFGCIELKLIL
jgi:hypothetical protein